MKPWYYSKTIWINIISMAIMALGTMMDWPEFSGWMPQLVLGINALNLALRLVTYEGVQ